MSWVIHRFDLPQAKVIKNITDALKNQGLYDNTVIVLSADNGGTSVHTPPVYGSSNYPLRGYKFSYFEGGIRAASFIHSPLLPKSVKGTRNSVLMHISDWYPTFCYLANITSDDGFTDAPHDGVNLWPLILGEENIRPASSWAEKGGP